MKPRENDDGIKNAAIFCLAALLLLGFVFLSPDASRQLNKSVYEIARDSPWRQWFDWAAVWCSIKIILLNLGVFLLLCSIATLDSVMRRRLAARLTISLMALPCVGAWIGIYFFIKALL